MKNKIIKEHFLDPRNMGRIENPTYESIARSETCNDIVKMTVVIADGVVEDIKTEVFGCGYTIAGASFFTEGAKGKRADRIMESMIAQSNRIISDIPEKHQNCIALSRKAFKIIYDKYSGEG